MMNVSRILVAAFILACALPAAGQDRNDPRNRRPAPQVRVVIPRYSGIFGRFLWRPQRTLLVVDDYIPGGRPLGISANYDYFDTAGRRYTDWNGAWSAGWPYVATGGVDVAPPAPTPKAASESAVTEGRARWRAGDAAGALECFKKAVAEDLASATARYHMAVALVAAGDLKNADKAVESALTLNRAQDALKNLSIRELFRTPRALERFESRLTPASNGTGAASVGLAQHLLGLKDKAAKTLEASKDPSAGKLREMIRE